MNEKNVGTIDRIIRMLAGLALVLWAFIGEQPWGFLGIILIITAIRSRCWLYHAADFTTVKELKKSYTAKDFYSWKK